MASDSPEACSPKPQGFRVSISPPSRDELDRVDDALAQDGIEHERAEGDPPVSHDSEDSRGPTP